MKSSMEINKMKLLKEQLVYDIKGDSIKIPFLYVKGCYLNDLYYRTLNLKVDNYFEYLYKQRVNIFFKKYFPKTIPKKISSTNKSFTVLKNNVDPSMEYDCRYTIRFSKLSVNGLFTNPSLIRMNSDRLLDVIKFFPQYLEYLDKGFQERLYKIILRNIKQIFITIKHEIIHLIDFQNSDNKRRFLFNQKQKQRTNSEYLLDDLEFPTWLSNTYSEIKALTSSGRVKLPYKMFAKFLKGENIHLENRVAHSTFLGALFKNNSRKHEEASKRLFQLLNKNYLYNDGYLLFSKPINVN